MTLTRFSTLLLILLLIPRGAPAADINWRSDYSKALREAADSGKPMIVVVGTEDCHWCKQLDVRTFAAGEVAKLLNDRFVMYKFDANRQTELARALRVQVYPSMYYAAPTGAIVGHQEGFIDAEPFRKKLVEVLVAVGTPDTMGRDYELAQKAVKDGDQARALALLRQVVEDGHSRPVQVKARKMIEELEGLAKQHEAKAREMVGSGKTAEAVAELMKLDRSYPGTPAAREGKQLLMRLTSRAEADRSSAAKELLEQARKDYKARQFMACLDRCEVLASHHADTEEAAEAGKLAAEIKANPDWTLEACDQLTIRLGTLYLSLAESYTNKGKPEQAVHYLERVVTMFPGSRQAEIARVKLTRLKDMPTEK
jgi:thioredoxin-related protein/outer membrane protein assembly factor BamD (BamD/ComL family)